MNTSTKHQHNLRGALASIIAVAALAAACTSSNGEPTTPSTTTAVTTTTKTPTATTTADPSTTSSRPTPTVSAANAAKAKAVQAVRRYFTLSDATYNDPRRPVEALHSVLSTEVYGPIATDINNERAAGWKSSGTVKVIFVRATSFSLSHGSKHATVTVKSCVDVSKTRGVDASGHSVVHRPTNFQAETDIVSNKNYPAGGWLITNGTNKFVKSC